MWQHGGLTQPECGDTQRCRALRAKALSKGYQASATGEGPCHHRTATTARAITMPRSLLIRRPSVISVSAGAILEGQTAGAPVFVE